MLYTITALFVIALVIGFLGFLLFLVALAVVITEESAFAISRAARKPVHALAGMRFRPQPQAVETNMRA